MEFLVEIEVALPPDMPSEKRDALMKKEYERGSELKQRGIIKRIWRVPGRLANVAVYEAPSADDVHAAIASLPLFPWMHARVCALATHPLEREQE